MRMGRWVENAKTGIGGVTLNPMAHLHIKNSTHQPGVEPRIFWSIGRRSMHCTTAAFPICQAWCFLYSLIFLCQSTVCMMAAHCSSRLKTLPWPGFQPGLLQPQSKVLTTIRSLHCTSLSWPSGSAFSPNKISNSYTSDVKLKHGISRRSGRANGAFIKVDPLAICIVVADSQGCCRAT